jgi:hypothetical protein
MKPVEKITVVYKETRYKTLEFDSDNCNMPENAKEFVEFVDDLRDNIAEYCEDSAHEDVRWDIDSDHSGIVSMDFDEGDSNDN